MIDTRFCTLSFDDGHERDQAVADVVRDCGAAATFYLIGERLRKLQRTWYDRIDVGSHTMTHRHPQEISAHQMRGEMADSKKAIEDWLLPLTPDNEVVGVAYPYGQVTREAVGCAMRAGYEYARMFCLDAENAYIVPDPFLLPITGYLDRTKASDMKQLVEYGKPFHLAGHGYHYDEEWKLSYLRGLILQAKDGGYQFLSNAAYIKYCIALRSGNG